MTEHEIYESAKQKLVQWAVGHAFQQSKEGKDLSEFEKDENGVKFVCMVLMSGDDLYPEIRICLFANTVNEDIDMGMTITEESDLDHIDEMFNRWMEISCTYLRTLI